MKISYVVTECRDKVSANCTKTFNREVKRGRPAVNCEACKAEVKPATAATIKVDGEASVSMDRTCPCGKSFTIKPGRGRKASKCDECRANGTVYRANEDGDLEAIRAETLAEEAREKAEQAGKDRAEALVRMMAPLHLKRERVVIHH